MNTDALNERVQQLAFRAATSAVERMQRYQDFSSHGYFHDRMDSTREKFVGIIPVLKQIFHFLFIGTFLMLLSIALYGFFYFIVMPPHAATEQLHFDYTCHETHIHRNVCNETIIEGQKTCSPAAAVDMFAQHSPWEAFHADLQPPPKTSTRILKVQQHYFLEVELQLPESNANSQLGMFGVEVELQKKGREPLARSLRSARFPHETNWIGAIRKLICLVPLLLGALKESRTVVVPAFRHYVEHEDHPLQRIVVRLVSPSSSWQNDIPVEVITGQLRIGKELNIFQLILKEWFWTCYIVGSTIIFFTLSLLVLVAKAMLDASMKAARQRREEEDLAEQPYFSDIGSLDPTNEGIRDEMDDQWEPMPQTDEMAGVGQTVDESIGSGEEPHLSNEQPIS